MENVNLNIMELPAIIMNDFIPFPHTEMRIDLTGNLQIESLKIAEQYDNMVVLLIPSKEGDGKYMEVAVVGKILLNMSMPGNTKRVKIQIQERCKVK